MPRMSGRPSARSQAASQRLRDRRNRNINRFKNAAELFENEMKTVDIKSCTVCRRATLGREIVRSVCNRCRGPNPNLFSAQNNMNIGFIPAELKDLSLIEQCLIAKIHPVVSVFRIRGQQIGYSGHVINFVQKTEQLFHRLPLRPASLSSILILNRQTVDGIAHFRVRTTRVRSALNWLIRNNQYYREVTIDEDIMEELPEDGDVSQLLMNMNTQDTISQEENLDNLLHISCFPNIPNINVEERINSNLRNIELDGETDWPDIGDEPENEFRTEGLICMAFPCLFPYGIGDINAPRLNKISRHDYFKFLLSYHDGRFANDLRFPYYAYNSMARWDAIKCGSVYVRLNQLEGLTAEDIADMANNQDRNIASNIIYYGATLRGTKSFWKQRCSELTQMVRQLGVPTIFFTLSAADYHWPDLFRIINPDRDPNTYSETERRKIMHDNPATVAWFFNFRVDCFLKKFLVKFFDINDFWYRYEWQHRGSPHIHGLLWLENSPDCNNIDDSDAGINQRQRIIDYFDEYVHATIGQYYQLAMPSLNPCRSRYFDIPERERQCDLDKILSTVQRHTNCGAHCLRRRRDSNRLSCRFGFPHQTLDTSELKKENGSWNFIPKRNDSLLQRHNRFVSQIWRGNTDFSAITSKDAVIKYISKYASKCEIQSSTCTEMLRSILERNNPEVSSARIIQQLLISSVAERNYSAQEIMHLIMGWPLFHASRTMVILSVKDDFRRYGNQPVVSFLSRYANRRHHDDLTLFEFAKRFKVSNGRVIARQKECIVRVVPYVELSDDPIKREEHYMLQCKLHIPWKNNFNDLKPQDTNWESFFHDERENNQRYMAEFEFETEEVIFESEPESDVEDIRDPGMALSRALPVHLNQRDQLGRRVIDESFEWPTFISLGISIESLDDYLTTFKRMADEIIRETPMTITETNMSEKQKEVISLMKRQLRDPDNSPKRIIVQGRAGTGKSAVIKFMSQYLQDACILLAPTGSAAVNIEGKTLHSSLRLPTRGDLIPLNGEALRQFQLEFSTIKFVIVDEYSMIGLRFLNRIHKRLCEASGESGQPFGGYNIYFFGDLRQLPPVMDKPIYGDTNDDATQLGKRLILSFQVKIVLSHCFRQSGAQAAFRNMLDCVSKGNITESHWEMLLSRRLALNSRSLNNFRDAVCLFPTNEMANNHNLRILSDNQQPVVIIRAEHNNSAARQGDDKLAEGLSRKLYISIGARVMLRRNICVAKGLVNGSIGTVHQIIYKPNVQPPNLPAMILIKFDKFVGPFFRDNCFALTPVRVNWKAHGVDCYRKQYPINLAYATTIHKSQGLTLDKVILDIGETELSIGCTYVGLSRVRSIDDLILRTHFNFSRLTSINGNQQLRKRERFMQDFHLSENN